MTDLKLTLLGLKMELLCLIINLKLQHVRRLDQSARGVRYGRNFAGQGDAILTAKI